MNQFYAETAVKRKDTFSTIGLKLLMILGVVVGLILMFLGSLFAFVGVAMVVAIVFFYPRLDVEYEYVFVDGQLDFDKISGKAKRKTMLRIDFERVEIMAPINSHALDSFNNIQLENKDFTSLKNDIKPYAIIANMDNKKMKILFEPSEKMVNMIKQKTPRKIETY